MTMALRTYHGMHMALSGNAPHAFPESDEDVTTNHQETVLLPIEDVGQLANNCAIS